MSPRQAGMQFSPRRTSFEGSQTRHRLRPNSMRPSTIISFLAAIVTLVIVYSASNGHHRLLHQVPGWSATPLKVVRGRGWEKDIKSALGIGSCDVPIERSYAPESLPRTVFTSYPRSGNTHLRTLVEFSSGYYTSSIVCDDVELQEFFPAECNSNNTFFLKAHFPVFQHEPLDESSQEYLDWWRQFDRVVWVQRAPFDAIFSLWNLMRTWKHEGRVELERGKLTYDEDSHAIFELTYMYKQHFDYWRRVPLPTLRLRYEDLVGPASVPALMNTLDFLLPPDQLPSMQSVVCADEGSTAYKSNKNQPLYAWDLFDDRLQEHILTELGQAWCAGGYDLILKEQRGLTPVDCTKVDMMS